MPWPTLDSVPSNHFWKSDLSRQSRPVVTDPNFTLEPCRKVTTFRLAWPALNSRPLSPNVPILAHFWPGATKMGRLKVKKWLFKSQKNTPLYSPENSLKKGIFSEIYRRFRKTFDLRLSESQDPDLRSRFRIGPRPAHRIGQNQSQFCLRMNFGVAESSRLRHQQKGFKKVRAILLERGQKLFKSLVLDSKWHSSSFWEKGQKPRWVSNLAKLGPNLGGRQGIVGLAFGQTRYRALELFPKFFGSFFKKWSFFEIFFKNWPFSGVVRVILKKWLPSPQI